MMIKQRRRFQDHIDAVDDPDGDANDRADAWEGGWPIASTSRSRPDLSRVEFLLEARTFGAAIRLLNPRSTDRHERVLYIKALIGHARDEQALSLCRELDPPDPTLTFQCLLRCRQFEKARRQLDELRTSPSYPSLLVQLLGISGDSFGMNQAVNAYVDTLDDSGRAEIYVAVAMQHQFKKEYEDALTFYRKASEFAELTIHELVHVASIQNSLGRTQEVVNTLSSMSMREGVSGQGVRLQFDLAIAIKDHDLGMDAVDRLMAYGLEDECVNSLRRGRLCLMSEDPVGAIDHYAKAWHGQGPANVRFRGFVALLIMGRWRRILK